MKHTFLFMCIFFAHHTYASDKKESLLSKDLKIKATSERQDISIPTPTNSCLTKNICPYGSCGPDDNCGTRTAACIGCAGLWGIVCTGLFCPQVCRR